MLYRKPMRRLAQKCATYVIDTDRTVIYNQLDEDYTPRAEPIEVLAEVESLVRK